MSPHLKPNNFAYRSRNYSKSGSELLLVLIARCIDAANIFNLLSSELARSVTLTARRALGMLFKPVRRPSCRHFEHYLRLSIEGRLSSFASTVSRVIKLTSKKQVVRPDAGRVVTPVENEQIGGNGPIVENPRYPVRVYPFFAKLKVAISARVFRTRPVPTRANAWNVCWLGAVFINLTPESGDVFFGKLSRSHGGKFPTSGINPSTLPFCTLLHSNPQPTH